MTPVLNASPKIRPIVIGLFRKGDHILVSEGQEPATGLPFYRPLGGGIEFGETSAEALAREIREELGEEITNLQLLGTIENIFTYGEQPRHEIVQVYDADFVDKGVYEQPELWVMEHSVAPARATWRTWEDFSPERPLYPTGLTELIASLPASH